MHNKKYRLKSIATENMTDLHKNILGKVCYLAFFRVGERGWFLCDTEELMHPVHKIHTSCVKDVKYTRGNQVVVSTENTLYVFEVILDE